MSHPASSSSDSSAACAKARDLIFARLEPLPGPREKPSDMFFLETHLEECPNCRDYQTVITREIHVLSDLQPVPVPAGLSDRIMARIAVEMQENPIKKRSRLGAGHRAGKSGNWKKVWPSMAAAVVLVAVGWSMSSSVFGPSAPHTNVATVAPSNQESTPAHKDALVAKAPERITPVATTPQSETPQVDTKTESQDGKSEIADSVDGLELAYAGEDRILDPEWSSGSVAKPVAKKASEERRAIESETIPVADSGESDDDPLSPLVGF
jgi:hypothetical protein